MDDYDDDGYGPPTQADEDWYWHHVALAQDRPPARNRQGEPMKGQATIYDLSYDTDSMHEKAEEWPSRVWLEKGTWLINGQTLRVEKAGYVDVNTPEIKAGPGDAGL